MLLYILFCPSVLCLFFLPVIYHILLDAPFSAGQYPASSWMIGLLKHERMDLTGLGTEITSNKFAPVHVYKNLSYTKTR